MEQNLPVLTKKVWNLMRVVFFMLRKGILKRKLLLDINMMIKRGKIAGKALQNFVSHHGHHNNQAAFATNHRTGEYEFSCSSSPSTHNHTFSLFSFHKKHHSSNQQAGEDDLDLTTVNAALQKAIAMIHSETASPALPGFGRSPLVRQLRVTDSPFPVSSVDEESSHVDEEAERFISRFYNDLRLQNTEAAFGSR